MSGSEDKNIISSIAEYKKAIENQIESPDNRDREQRAKRRTMLMLGKLLPGETPLASIDRDFYHALEALEFPFPDDFTAKDKTPLDHRDFIYLTMAVAIVSTNLLKKGDERDWGKVGTLRQVGRKLGYLYHQLPDPEENDGKQTD